MRRDFAAHELRPRAVKAPATMKGRWRRRRGAVAIVVAMRVLGTVRVMRETSIFDLTDRLNYLLFAEN